MVSDHRVFLVKFLRAQGQSSLMSEQSSPNQILILGTEFCESQVSANVFHNPEHLDFFIVQHGGICLFTVSFDGLYIKYKQNLRLSWYVADYVSRHTVTNVWQYEITGSGYRFTLCFFCGLKWSPIPSDEWLPRERKDQSLLSRGGFIQLISHSLV